MVECYLLESIKHMLMCMASINQPTTSLYTAPPQELYPLGPPCKTCIMCNQIQRLFTLISTLQIYNTT
jgi:hypothetical protein